MLDCQPRQENVCLYVIILKAYNLHPHHNYNTIYIHTNLCPNFPTLCSTYRHMILLFTIITPQCLHPTTSSATPTNESIANDPTGVLNSWNHSVQFCNWYGTTCGHHHRRVMALALQGHKLRGTITPYIGNLTFLRAINI